MTPALGVVMDPIGSIHAEKDTTLAMLLAAQARDMALWYMEPADLYLSDGGVQARMRRLTVHDDAVNWHEFIDERDASLEMLDAVLMRKDPPFDAEYLYTTYLLELAEARGVLVVNRPRALRDWNEKLATARFPQCSPPTLVTCDITRLRAFWREHGAIVVKPLDAMGGQSVFVVHAGDSNASVIFELMSARGTRTVMAQRYLPEVVQGDKRIVLIDGVPIPYVLARIPAPGEARANLAAGGRGEGMPLSARDRWLCEQIGPTLREQGLLFVGLDVIGDYVTEINVTSPTGIRELERQYGLDIAGRFIETLTAALRISPAISNKG